MKKDEFEWKSIAEIALENKDEFMKIITDQFDLQIGIEEASNYFDILRAVKAFYLSNEAAILSTPENRWYTSYPADWTKIFTPIEQRAWESIRVKGKIVLYPQYPVGKFFIDFANPRLKIGLELDGKAYHDKEKDTLRDKELQKQGWTIYRITGAEMNRGEYKTLYEIDPDEMAEDEVSDALGEWLLHTGDGVIEAIRQIHFDEIRYPDKYSNPDWWDVYDQYIRRCYQTLELHQLA